MLNQAYAESIEDAQRDARNQESKVLSVSIEKMSDSDGDRENAAKRQEAISFTSRVWNFLLDDLTSRDNQSSDELKAALISIGIYIMKYLEKMRKDQNSQFHPLIEITSTILLGLE